MKQGVRGARPADQALAVPVEPVSRLDPTGVDPSRKSIVQRCPEDIVLGWSGGTMRVSFTCETTHELDAVFEALTIMRTTLTGRREMVLGDIDAVPPERPFAERMIEFLGVPPAASDGEAVPEDIRSKRDSRKAIAMETRRAETSGSVAKP